MFAIDNGSGYSVWRQDSETHAKLIIKDSNTMASKGAYKCIPNDKNLPGIGLKNIYNMAVVLVYANSFYFV